MNVFESILLVCVMAVVEPGEGIARSTHPYLGNKSREGKQKTARLP